MNCMLPRGEKQQTQKPLRCTAQAVETIGLFARHYGLTKNSRTADARSILGVSKKYLNRLFLRQPFRTPCREKECHESPCPFIRWRAGGLFRGGSLLDFRKAKTP